MIDYYYEFPEGSRILSESVRYGFLRGYHPDLKQSIIYAIHEECYKYATRIWIENANGLTLVREHGQDVHKRSDPKIMTWIKLQAKEIYETND